MSKYNDKYEYDVEQEIVEDIDETDELENSDKYNDIIFDLQQEMIEYTEKIKLPLCDYMTHNLVDDFVIFLHTNYK